MSASYIKYLENITEAWKARDNFKNRSRAHAEDEGSNGQTPASAKGFS